MNNMKPTAPFAHLLREAVTVPGMISQAYSQFHNYSLGNQLWAWAQCMERKIPLGPIATFKKWQELGRNVKKGQRAIALVMPVTVKQDDAEKEISRPLTIFVIKNYWFTLDQTDGAEYKHEVPTPSWNREQALAALNITEAPFDIENGNVQGFARLDSIAINPVAEYPHKTRFHELAHIVLGHTREGTMTDSDATPKNIREVEAESVAYIICSVLDLPGLTESRGYIQLWLNNGEICNKSAQKIFAAANKILEAGKVKAE